MQVELAEERIFRMTDRFSLEHAEGRAWSKRLEAFGALARVTGLFAQPKDEEFAVVYRERRLQPFWRVTVSTATAYERTRTYAVKVPPEVREVTVGDAVLPASNGQIQVVGLEACREETRRETVIDGLNKQASPALANYLQHDAIETDAAALAVATTEGMVIVPPEAKASMVVRDVIASAIGKIDADRVTEELVRVEAVDLYYRPVHAFRYRRGDKEAVVEFDAITGETKVGGATFEQYLGKALEPKFLLDVGAETLNFVIPGANLAKLMIVKGLELKAGK
ncbi:MAG TPA: hypothetical protein VM471_07960 [Phenylobacterium sp.]|nr:hypothetical protein [Phenylobacterium sp.]